MIKRECVGWTGWSQGLFLLLSVWLDSWETPGSRYCREAEGCDSLQGVTSVNLTGKSSSHIQQLLSPDGLPLNSCLRASVAAVLTVGLMANGEVPPVDGDPRLEGGGKTGVNQQRIGVDLRAKSDAFSLGFFTVTFGGRDAGGYAG